MDREIDNLEEVCEAVTQRMCVFLGMDRPILTSLNLEDRVCEIVAYKMMHILGIRCKYNYKNELINFFASVIGDVILERIGFRFTVAQNFRYVKYNGINFEREISNIFERGQNVDTAIASSIHFLEEHKQYVAEIVKVNKLATSRPAYT